MTQSVGTSRTCVGYPRAQEGRKKVTFSIAADETGVGCSWRWFAGVKVVECTVVAVSHRFCYDMVDSIPQRSYASEFPSRVDHNKRDNEVRM